MNKKLYFILSFLLAIPLTSCNFDINPTDVMDNYYDIRRIYITEENVAVNVGEKRFVEVKADSLGPGGSIEKLVYTSCDSNVATAKYGEYDDPIAEKLYQGMYIEGKQVGYTSIIASFKNASSSVDVNVVRSDEIPYIHLFDTSLYIEKGTEYVLNSDILFKGKTYNILENDVNYEFTYIEGQPDDIVDLYQDDITNNIIVNPLKVGSTKVIVSTNFMNVNTSTLLTINVTEPGVGIVINNPGFEHKISNSYATKIYVKDYGKDYHQTLDLDIDLYNGDELLKDEKIALTSEDPSIATVNGYQIKGVSKGNTVIKGTYQGVNLEINVNVDKPYITCPITTNNFEVDVDPRLVLTNESLLSSNILGVYYQTVDSESVFDNYDGHNINLDVSKLHSFVDDFGENKKFYIETEEIYIDTGATNVYSKIINNYNDLLSWGSIAESYVTDKFNYNGYFVLGSNIECGNQPTQIAFDRDTNFKIEGISECYDSNIGFNGVFDGRGYTINNYKPKGFGSFITWLTKDGELKNIGFSNVTLDTSLINNDTDPKVSLIANGQSNEGEYNIKNVYVDYKSITTPKTGKYDNRYMATFNFTSKESKYFNCSCVFVKAIDASITGDFDVLGKMICDGVYSLGGTHINGDSSFGTDPVVKDREFNCSGTFNHFTSEASMRENLETKSTIARWDKTYWGNLDSGIPSWNTAK